MRLEELEARLAPTVYTWTGGGGAGNPYWSSTANWGGSAPVANQTGITLDFGTPTAYNAVNDLPGLGISAITFTNSNFTLTAKTAADNVTLNSALITVQNGLSGENLDLPMTLSGAQIFSVNPGSTLTLGTSGTSSGTLTGNSALLVKGGGTLLIQTNSSATPFTGAVTIGNNDTTTVEADSTGAFGSGAATNTVTVETNAQLQLEGGITLPNTLYLSGHGTSGVNGALQNVSGANTWSGNIVMVTSVEFNIQGATSSLTVSGVISDAGSGEPLVKNGPGQLILQNANTYRGQTDINQGVLTIENPLALGAVPSAGTFTNANTASTASQGSLQLELLNGATSLTTVPANSQYYILGNPAAAFNATTNPYVGFVVPDYTLNLVGSGYNGSYTLDNATGDNAWSGPVILGSAVNGNIGVQVEDDTVAGVQTQTQLDITGVISDSVSVPITAATWAANVATITGINSFTAGQTVVISGVTPSGYDGTFTVASATSSSFTYNLFTNPGGSGTSFGAASDPAQFNKVDNFPLTSEGNLILEPTVHNTTIDQGSTYKLYTLPGGFVDLAQFTGTGTANTYMGATGVGFLNGGTVTIEDSQGLGPTTKTAVSSVGQGSSLNLVANVGHIDSVTGTTNHLLVDTPLSLNGPGYAVNGVDEGTLHSISGINTYGPNAAYNAANPTKPYVIGFNIFGGCSIGVEPDPTESTNNSYFTNDYSLSITGGLGYDPPFGYDPIGTIITKLDAGQLILPTANRYFYGGWEIKQGWVTVEDPYSLGGLINGAAPGVAQGAIFNTQVDSGAALMLRSDYPNTSLNLNTNLILEGDGISHAYGLISDAGAVENLEGVNTLSGNITLLGQVGIGVEQVDPTILSDLTLTGEITQAQTTAAFNSVAIPATIAVPTTYAAGGISQYTQIVDAGSSQGSIVINYSNFVNDNLRVYYGAIGTPGSSLVYNTTLSGTGATAGIPFGPGPGTQIEIVVDKDAIGTNTSWSYSGTVTVSAGYFVGGIVKLGSQRLVLEGAGTFEGGVDIRAGIVVDENNAALGTPLDTGAPGFTYGTTVEAGTALVLSPTVASMNGGISDGESVWGTPLTLNGSGNTTFGYAPLAVTADDNQWTGTITLNADIAIAYQGTLGDQAMPADPITANFTTAATGLPTLTGTTPTAEVTQTTVGSATAQLSDIETLSFGGIVTGGTFTLTIWDGTAYFTTGSITWNADQTALIEAIQGAMNADSRLKNNFNVSLVSPTINVAPNARMNVSGTITDGGAAVPSPLVHEYTFTGGSASFNDQVGSIPITPVGGSLTAAGYTWSAVAGGNAANQGLTLPASALPTPTDYTIQIDFDFTDVNPGSPVAVPSTGYDRIINYDVTPNTSANADNGLYTLADGGAGATLTAYPSGTSGPNNTFLNNVPVDLIVTRDAATGNVQAYVNGVAQFLPFGFDDSAAFPTGNEFVLQGPLLQFFIDDNYVPDEVSSGTATSIKIYNRALTSSEVATVYAGGTLGSAASGTPAELMVSGGGELSLSGANTYRGTTYVNQGTMTIGNGQALGGTTIAGEQSLALTNAVAGSTNFKLSYGGASTGAIPYAGTAADAANIQTALTGLATIGSTTLTNCTNSASVSVTVPSTALLSVGMPVSGAGIPAGDAIASIVNGTGITLTQAATNSNTETLVFGNVSVIQENAGIFLVTFYGPLASTQTLISASISGGAVSGTAIAAGFEGGTEVANGAQLQMQGGITVANEPLTLQGTGSNLEPSEQTFTVSTTTTGGFSGTYNLNFNGATTAALPYDATAAQVQAALQNLGTVASVGGQVSVNLLSVSAGADDTQTLFVPSTATNATNFGLTFGPTAYDVNTYSTGNIFSGFNTYNATDPLANATVIANALNALTNITEQGGLVTVSGGFATEGGVNGQLYTIAFAGGLANLSTLPALAIQAAPAPSGPGAGGIAMETHRAGAAPSQTFQVTYQGSFSGTNQPVLTVPAVTGTTTVSAPAVTLTGGSANSTPDQWFSNFQGTGTTPTAISNVDPYIGSTTNAENASGPVTSVATDPTDPNVIYIATAGGGAWKTQDGGQTWQPLFDAAFSGANPAVMFGGAIAVDPQHPNIIYFGTGEANYSGTFGGFNNAVQDSYYGTGIYMSVDSGATWTLLTDTSNAAYTVNSSSPGNPLYGTAISKILVIDANGTTPQTIVASVTDAKTGYGVDVNGLQGNAGVWLYDQGKWTNTIASAHNTGSALPTSNTSYSDIYMDGNTLYAALSDGSAASGVYSVNNFLGAAPGPWNWGVDHGFVTGGITNQKLAGNGSGTVFDSESSSGSLGQIQWINPPGSVNTWTTIANAAPAMPGNIPDYLNQISGYDNAMVEINGDLFVGGHDQGSGTNFLLESTNSGTTWTDIVHGLATGPESGIHGLTADKNGDLIVASDGGVWKYAAGVWTDITGNLADAQFNSVATDPNNANIILAGGKAVALDRYSLGAVASATLTGGVVTTVTVLDGSGGYSTLNPPAVTFVGGDPTTPASATALVNAAGQVTGIMLSGGGAGYQSAPEIVIAPSGVQTWTQVAGGGNDVLAWGGSDSTAGEVQFVPTQPGAAYFQNPGGFGSGLNYSTDDGVTWTWTNAYGSPPPEFAPFVLDPNNPNSLIAATGTGSASLVSYSAAGFGGASSVSANFPFGWGAITAIGAADFQGAYQADPSFTGLTVYPANHPDASTLYVTDGKHVAVTKNLGANWDYNRAPTLAAGTTISDLIVDPADRDTAFAVTSGYSGTAGVGHVFETTNAGQTWTDISAGLPDLSVWTIADDPRTNNLYVGTDSGVYELAGGVGTWQKFGAGLPNVMVTDININTNANVLTISTYGRGTWQYYLDDTTANAGALRALGGNNVWNGPITLVGPTTIGVNGSQNLADGFSGATLTVLQTISDSTPSALGNTLTKIGGGDLILAGANTYAGVTLANQGNVEVDNTSALGSAGVAGSQMLYFNNMVAGVSHYNLTFGSGAGSTTAAPLTYTGVAATDALNIQNALQGLTTIGGAFVTVTPEGSGAFLLTFSGALASTQLLATASIAKSATPAATSVNGPLGSSFTEIAGGTVVASGAALELQSSLALEPITLNGNGIQPPFDGHYTGALENVSNLNTYTGTLTLNTNSTIGVTAGQLTIASANTYGIVDGGTAATAYSLDKEGDGTLILAGPDSYQGGTTVTVGAVEIENSAALGASTSSTVVDDGAQLQLAAAAGPTLSTAVLAAGTNLTLGTTYYYVVTAVNASGDESVVSNQLKVTPSVAGTQAATLTWSAPAGAGPFTYNVYRSTTAGNFTDALVASGITLTTYTDASTSTLPATPGGLKVLGQHLYLAGSGLTNNGALSNVAGNNTWAGLITLSSVPAYSTVSSPEGVVAIDVDPTNTLTLSNNINEGPPIVAPAQNAPVGVTGAGLGAGPFYYLVTAVTPYGESATPVSSQTTYTPSGGKNQVTLSWSAVAGATSYNIYRSTTSGNFANAAVYSSLTTTFTDTGAATTAATPNAAASSGLAEIGAGTLVLAGNNTYTGGTYVGYVFGNVNDSGAVAPSQVGSGGVNGGVIDIQSSGALGADSGNEIQRLDTFEPPNTSAQPFQLSFNGVSTGNINFGAAAATVQADLDGLSTIGANGVTVSESSVQTGLDEVQTVSLTNPTSALNAPTLSPITLSTGGNLTASTRYYYEVTAVIPGLGESIPSAAVSVMTSAASTTANLTWSAVAGATSYKIYRSTVAGNFNQAYLTSVTGTSYTDAGFSAAVTAPAFVALTSTSIGVGGSVPLGTYNYVITALGSTGSESAVSTALSVTFSTAGEQEVNLSWAAVPGATGYRIYRSTTTSYANALIATIGSGATTSYTDSGIVSTSFSPPVQTQYTVSFGGKSATLSYLGVGGTAAGSDAAAIEAALQGLTSIGAGNVLVTPDATDTIFTITFIGALSDTPQSTIGVAVGAVMNGTIAAGSLTTVTLTSTTGLLPGMLVSGTGIPTGATIVAVNSMTTITLSAAGKAGANVPLTFAEPATSAAAAEVTPGDGGLSYMYTVQFTGASLGGAAQPLIVATAASNELTVSSSETATGGIGVLVYSGAALQVDGDPAEANPSTTAAAISIPAGQTLALNGDGFETLTLGSASAGTTTFTLQVGSGPYTVGTNKTTAITYTGTSADASAVQTALNALTAITSTVGSVHVAQTNSSNSETFTITGLNTSAPIAGTVTSTPDAAIFDAPAVVAGALLNVSGNDTWQGNIILQSSSTIAAAATTQLSVTGLVQSAPVSASAFAAAASATPDPTTPPASLTKVGAGTVSLAPATQVINLSNAVSTLNAPALNVPTVSGSGAVSTQYYYEVTAIGTNGETLPSVPQKPATVPANQLVNLTWTNAAGFTPTGYRIYRSTLLAGPFDLLANIDSGSTLSYVDNGSITPSAVTPPTQTQFKLSLGAFTTAAITYTGAASLASTGAGSIQSQLQTLLTAHYAGVTASVTALSASGFTVAYAGTAAALAAVPALSAAVVNGTSGSIAIDTNTFTGDVYDNAGVLNIQSAQALGVSTSAVEEISVSGSSGAFQLTFNGQTTGALQYGLSASGGASATASVQNALNALSTIGANGVTVTQTGNNYFVYFTGPSVAYQYQNPIGFVSPLAAGISSITITHPLAGGATNVDVASGAALQTQSNTPAQAFGEASGKYLTIAGTGPSGNGALENVSGANSWSATPITLGSTAAIGADGTSALTLNKAITDSFLTPTIQFSGFTAGDTYSLSYGGAVTGPLTYTGVAGTGAGSDGAVILAALKALSSVIPLGGTVGVTALGGHKYNVTFSNTLYGTFAPGIGSIPITTASTAAVFVTPVPPATSNADGVNKVGAGTVQFNVANTYTGLTNVVAGTLKLDNTTGSGFAVPGNLQVGDDTLVPQVQTLTFSNFVQLDQFTLSYAGAPSVTTAPITYYQNPSYEAAAIQAALNAAFGSASFVNVTATSSTVFVVSLPGLGDTAATTLITGNDITTAAGTVSDPGITSAAAAALTPGAAGAPTVQLEASTTTGANAAGQINPAASNPVTVLNDGLLDLNDKTQTLSGLTITGGVANTGVAAGGGGNLTVTGNVLINSGGALNLPGSSDLVQIDGTLTMVGGSINMTGTGSSVDLKGNVTAQSDPTTLAAAQITGQGTLLLDSATPTFTVNKGGGNSDLVVSAPIAATATDTNGALTKTGAGRLELAAENTYGGNTVIDAGDVQVDAVFTLTLPGAFAANSSTFTLSFTNGVQSAGPSSAISYTGSTLPTGTAAGILAALQNLLAGLGLPTGGIFVNAVSGNPNVFAIAFSVLDGVNLTSATAGVTLESANDTGNVVLNGAAANTASLSGTGTVGNVSIAAGMYGTVNPGINGTSPATPGVLSTVGNVTFNTGPSNGTFFVDLNNLSGLHPGNPGTDYDQLDVNGTVTLNNAVLAGAPTGAGLQVNDEFTIIQATAPVAGFFDTFSYGTLTQVNNGATVFLNGQSFKVNYNLGGDNVVLTKELSSLTSFTLTSSANPSVYGQDVTFTALATPQVGASFTSANPVVTFDLDGGVTPPYEVQATISSTVQEVSLSGFTSGNTFTLTYFNGVQVGTTAPITYTGVAATDAASIATALNNLLTVAPFNFAATPAPVSVAAVDSNDFTITFSGAATTNIYPLISATPNVSLASVATYTPQSLIPTVWTPGTTHTVTAAFADGNNVFAVPASSPATVVQAINQNTVGIAVVAPDVAGTITGASNAAQIVITSPLNGLVNGQTVTITGVLGDTAANTSGSATWTVSNVTANTFTINASGVASGVYTGGGVWVHSNPVYGQTVNISTTGAPGGVATLSGAQSPTGTFDYVLDASTTLNPTVPFDASPGATPLQARQATSQAIPGSTLLAPGSHTLAVSYNAGDPDYFASTAPISLPFTVVADSTSVAFTPAPVSSNLGQNATFNVVVSPGLASSPGHPQGAVNFYDGNPATGGTLLNASTTTTGSFNIPTVGSTTTINVNAAAGISVGQYLYITGSGNTILASVVAPGVSGNSVTIQTDTIVAGLANNSVATGATVILASGVNAATGAASLSTPTLALGTHTIYAVYTTANGNYTSSANSYANFIVQKGATGTAIQTPLPAASYGTSSMFTVHVSENATTASTFPSIVPTGNVTLYANTGPSVLTITSAFNIPAIGSSTSITVASNSGFTAGQALYITGSGDAFIATVVGPVVAGASLTIQTVAIISGAATSSVAVGASVAGLINLGQGALSGATPFTATITTAATGASALPVGSNIPLIAVYSGDGNFLVSADTSQTINVTGAAANTSVSATTTPGIYTSSMTFTATVTSTVPTPPTGAGSYATFWNGAVGASTGTAAGQSFTILAVGGQTPAITVSSAAAFGNGDTVYITDGTHALIATVAITGSTMKFTTTSLVSGTVAGQTMAAGASVADMTQGALGTAALAANGTAQFTVAGGSLLVAGALSAGLHTITASYLDTADSHYANGLDTPLSNYAVDAAPTKVVVNAPSTATPAYGQSVTLNATVSTYPGGFLTTDTGSVKSLTFWAGAVGTGTLLGAASVSATGQASFTGVLPLAASATPYTINASYADGNDAFFAPSNTTLTGSGSLTVTAAPTTTALASSSPGNTSQIGAAAVTYTATVNRAAPSTVALVNAGSVSFFDTASITAASWSGNVATITAANSFNVGQTVSITGVTPTAYDVVNATITGVTSSSFTFALTGSNPGSGGAGTANVSLGTNVAVATSGASMGTASLNVTYNYANAGGVHDINATYNPGAPNFQTSNAPAIAQTVLETAALTVTPNVAAPTYGQAVNLGITLARVSPSVGTPTGGTVTVVDQSNGNAVIGTGTVANGTVTGGISLAGPLSVGTHNLLVSYSGDSASPVPFAPVSTTYSLKVAAAATSISATPMTSSVPATSELTQPVTFTATLSVTSGGTPGLPSSGTVTFKDGTTVLQTVTLTGSNASSGPVTVTYGVNVVIAYTTSTLALSSTGHTITATYSGGGNFAAPAAASNTVTQKVVAEGTLGALGTTAWTQNSPYSSTITFTKSTAATGTIPLSSVTVSPGSLPSGLGYNITAQTAAAVTITISGTPNTTGVFTPTFNVTDSLGTVVSRQYSITINAQPALGTLNSVAGYAYKTLSTGTIAISGGTGPFTFAPAVAGLPAGLSASISGSTITISGTPTAAGGPTNFSVGIKDASGATTTHSYSITVTQAATSITAVTASVATALEGTAVTYMATVTSAAGPANTGTVQFFDSGSGGTQSAVSLVSTTATTAVYKVTITYAPNATSHGVHNITAQYLGSSNFAASAVSTSQATVSVVNTAIALTASTTAPTAGQYVTFTVTLTVVGGGAAGQTITLYDNGVAIGTATLGAGVVSGSNTIYTVTFSKAFAANTKNVITASFTDPLFDPATTTPVTVTGGSTLR